MTHAMDLLKLYFIGDLVALVLQYTLPSPALTHRWHRFMTHLCKRWIGNFSPVSVVARPGRSLYWPRPRNSSSLSATYEHLSVQVEDVDVMAEIVIPIGSVEAELCCPADQPWREESDEDLTQRLWRTPSLVAYALEMDRLKH